MVTLREIFTREITRETSHTINFTRNLSREITRKKITSPNTNHTKSVLAGYLLHLLARAGICQHMPAFWPFAGGQLANTPAPPAFTGESWHTPAFASSRQRFGFFAGGLLANTPALASVC
jgi:hypothetical protein